MRRSTAGLSCLVPVLVLFGGLAGAHRAAAAPAKKSPPGSSPAIKVSEATANCLMCHESVLPGIHEDWRRSRHAQITPRQALAKEPKERRISTKTPPAELADVVVGCAECHTLNADSHADTFEHGDLKVHVVVTPKDCAVCHPTEAAEFDRTIMSRAYVNLVKNPLYVDVMKQTVGVHQLSGERLFTSEPDPESLADACFACHGTEVKVIGTVSREGMDFPVLSGWPNQGVGRLNPDGSLGACTACHTRHEFSIAMARKPATCGQCHSGPDVPAKKIYDVSKHGNLYEARGAAWDFDAVPWIVGKHFQAPTCAACHMSELVEPSGALIVPRTHELGQRLPYRLFGLPYAHNHPRAAETYEIRNADGLPLPTAFDGTPAEAFLIDAATVAARKETMKKVCRACHSTDWVDGHFVRLDKSIETTNAMTKTATELMQRAWKSGAAAGARDKRSIFDEPIERLWVENWLMYGNSIRMATAMGGADYGVFAGGRWQQSKNLREIHEWVKEHPGTHGKP